MVTSSSSIMMLNPHQRCGAPGEHRHGDSESDCARAGVTVTVDFYIYQYRDSTLVKYFYLWSAPPTWPLTVAHMFYYYYHYYYNSRSAGE